jgi:hypothetical protein
MVAELSVAAQSNWQLAISTWQVPMRRGIFPSGNCQLLIADFQLL